MRGISALFLLAPGLTGVVGGYLKAVRMIHIWLYDPTRRHIVYEMLQLWLSLASSSWLQVDQRHGGHIAPILWSQGIEANYCNCRSLVGIHAKMGLALPSSTNSYFGIIGESKPIWMDARKRFDNLVL